MEIQEKYMQRCLQLAVSGLGFARPNPVVGAVLVYADRVIGEGYHRAYGGPHAEVECINSVSAADRHLISEAQLYVSLEPCAHFGKTPPCADLVIRMNIRAVAVGCRDPFEQVDGKGIERMRQAGVEVVVGVLEKECQEINRRFFTFHLQHRPYIILKWAQSSNGKIAATGQPTGDRTLISNGFSNRLVHRWRQEEAAIMVGTQTAIKDNPSLTNRLWKGNHPTRVLIDLNLKVPRENRIFDAATKTIILNNILQEEQGNLLYQRLSGDAPPVRAICNTLFQLKIQSVLVEGGSRLLQSFINCRLFDEARVIENQELRIEEGVAAPELTAVSLSEHYNLEADHIRIYKNASAEGA